MRNRGTQSWIFRLKQPVRNTWDWPLFVIGFGFLIWGASSRGWWFVIFSRLLLDCGGDWCYLWLFAQPMGRIFRGRHRRHGKRSRGSRFLQRRYRLFLPMGSLLTPVVYYLAKPLEVLPGMITSAGMVVQTIINPRLEFRQAPPKRQ